jgi:hypothetical protein
MQDRDRGLAAIDAMFERHRADPNKAAIEQHLAAIEEITKRDPEVLKVWEEWLSNTDFVVKLYSDGYGGGYRDGYDDAKAGRPYESCGA